MPHYLQVVLVIFFYATLLLCTYKKKYSHVTSTIFLFSFSNSQISDELNLPGTTNRRDFAIFRFSSNSRFSIVSMFKINLPRTVPNFYSFISLGTCLSQRRYSGKEKPKDKKEKCSRSRHGRKSAMSGEFLQECGADLPRANIPR